MKLQLNWVLLELKISEISKAINEAIEESCGDKAKNDADKTAKLFATIPHFLIKFSINFVKFLDKHGILPKKLISVSPFHTSCFITNLKSIHLDSINHHLYNFGTTGMFVSIGKEEYKPIVENGEINIAKILNLGVVADERICDGFYHANALRLFQKLIKDPTQLEQNLDKIVEDAK
jgi:hypothetical protein